MLKHSLIYDAILRERCIQLRQARGLLNAFLLFCMILIFFPLILPADPILLREVFPGLVWIALLFSFFLSAEHLFQYEEEAGVLDQWLISDQPLHLRIRAKLIVHWVAHILPVGLSIPFFMILFHITAGEVLILLAVLVLGSPVLLLFCALAATFSTQIQQKGILMALIILPLTLPVMILGSGTIHKAMQNLAVNGEIALLFAMSLTAFLCLPWVMAGALRIGR